MTAVLDAPGRNGGRLRPRDVVFALAGAVSLVLAAGAASTVDLPVNSDLGLVAVLPYPYWMGLVLINLTFIAALRGTPGPGGPRSDGVAPRSAGCGAVWDRSVCDRHTAGRSSVQAFGHCRRTIKHAGHRS
ncbi:hypothetical protein OUO20_07685 [Arthrobacter sp. FX8]|uniref:hypothetical protein n=1 Tax=Arthrobacter sp. FX8 TaxID=2997335 RepID=UPI00227A7484|nr:hypothetical protein [Arthrobacter sp. FX8]WAJ34758.1 hypothetical protein OUO20_07685 [Arthrobacter sp. FX8]